MKQNNQPRKHLEIKTYVNNGVSVCVEINYDAGTISLLESTTKQPKKWVFASRQVEYMPGWLDILDAMKLAVAQAEDDLLKHQVLKKKELEQKEKELQKAILDMKPNEFKQGYIGHVDNIVLYKPKKK